MAIILDGTNGISSPDFEMSGVGVTYPLVSGTVATASGTAIDFTAIPSWVKRITVMFSGVSTSGTSPTIIQLGDAGGIENTGYLGAVEWGTTTSSGLTSGVLISSGGSDTAAAVRHGVATFTNLSGNNWCFVGNFAFSNVVSTILLAGSKSLSDVLTQIRITTVNGTDTFDAGTINIAYE